MTLSGVDMTVGGRIPELAGTEPLPFTLLLLAGERLVVLAGTEPLPFTPLVLDAGTREAGRTAGNTSPP